MLSLLTGYIDGRYKTLRHKKLSYVEGILNNFMSTITNYYSDNNAYVTRPNMLVTLLESLSINIHNTRFDVQHSLEKEAEYLSNMVGMVTTRNINANPIYDTVYKGLSEYFIYTEDTDIPLTCIYSTLDDLLLTHPQMVDREFNGDDYNIYTVNVILLGLQYYDWARGEIKRNPETYSIDPAKFIYSVAITDAIPSIFKHNVFTRLSCIYRQEEVSKFVNYNPFYTRDVYTIIDIILKWYLKEIDKNSKLTYLELLNKIPNMLGGSIYDEFRLPNIYFNNKNSWVLALSRVNMFTFILDISDSRLNKQYINELSIWLKLAGRRRYFEIPNLKTKYLLQEQINNLKDKL